MPDQAPSKPIKPKIGKNVLGCAGLALAFLLLCVIGAGLAVAESGILRVPVFSSFYSGPIPTRTVTVPAMSADAFKNLLGSRFFAAAAKSPQPPYSVRITERELTAVLKSAVGGALRDQSWQVEASQVVLRPDAMELYGRFSRNGVHLDVLIEFVPVVQNGGVRFDPVSIHLGEYPISPALAMRIAGIVFSRDLGTFFLTFGDARLQSVALHDGSVDITAASLKSK